MDVLCFGEILFDKIGGKSYLGGAPLNFAAHMKRLGARSFILSRLGMDENGDKALSEVEELGVVSKFIQRDPDHATGEVDVVLNEGSPEYTFNEKAAYDFIDLEEFIVHYTIAEFSFLYFGTLAQRNEVSRSTLWQLTEDIDFPEVFFDINLRENFYTPEIVHVSLHKATIFKLNDEEVVLVSKMLYEREMDTEELCSNLSADFQLKLIIVTKGGEGCSVYENDSLVEVAGEKVEVRDTVGAGDAFSAAFMFYYLKDGDSVKAAEKANKLGAFVASSDGAIPDYSPEIKEALKD